MDRLAQYGLWYPRYQVDSDRLTCLVDASPFTSALLRDGDPELMAHFAEQLGLGEAALAEWSVSPFNTPFYSFDIDADEFGDWMSPAWRVRLVVAGWQGAPPTEPGNPVPAFGYDRTWYDHRTPWDWNAQDTVVIAVNGPHPKLDFLAELDRKVEVETLMYERRPYPVSMLRIGLGRMDLPAQGDAVFDVVEACHRRAMPVHTNGAGGLLEPRSATYLDQRRRGVHGMRSRPAEPILPVEGTQPSVRPAMPASGTKIALIGAVPEHWQEVRLDECCEVQSGPSGSLLSSDDYVLGGDIPVISARDIGIDGINPSPAISVSKGIAQRLSERYRVWPGDILLVRVCATTRFVTVTETQNNWLISSSCIRIRIRPDRKVEQEYLSCYLGHYAVQEWLADLTGHGVIPTLSAERVSGLPIVLPPATVQADLASAASAIDAEITAHLDAIRAARVQREQLLPGLLSRS